MAERFKLGIHRETKTVETFVLEVAKNGPKLERAADAVSTTGNSRGLIDANTITMDRFAEVLSRQMDLPVVNYTGLEGRTPERRTGQLWDERCGDGQRASDLHSDTTAAWLALAIVEDIDRGAGDRSRGKTVGELNGFHRRVGRSHLEHTPRRGAD